MMYSHTLLKEASSLDLSDSSLQFAQQSLPVFHNYRERVEDAGTIFTSTQGQGYVERF